MRSTKSRITLSVLLTLSLCLTAAAQGGFDPARLDTTCEPCQDFYQFANGNWLKANAVPAAYSRWGSFQILAERNNEALRDILEASAKNAAAARHTNDAKIGAFYAACMDEAKIEAAGAKPLAADFARIDKIKDARGVAQEVARLHRQGVSTLFGFAAIPDAKNSTTNIAFLGQGGLSLPNRDYYTKTDDKSKQVREEFVKHVARMFEHAGDDAAKAAANAKTLMSIQTRLAEASRDPVAVRDPQKNYNRLTLAQLKEQAPNVAWDDYFAGVGAPKFTEANVGQPEFFKAVSGMMSEVPVADWKTYLRWHMLTQAAPFLSSKFEQENFNFYGGVLTGAKEQLPRWRRCVSATDDMLGEALGEVYVRKAFTPESKARMETMINNLLNAFRARINRLDWMGGETRKEALAKLEAFRRKIGYPEKWRDYSALSIDRASNIENARRAASFEVARNVARIGRPVDRTEWGMTPPTVNAYYSALLNEIAFPAGILQPPFFDPKADDAINYGAIGAVIGHEVSHGFDNRGSQFDAVGNLRMWWTPEDRKRFDDRAECIVKQFESYEMDGGVKMIGKLVIGESIADLGGLSTAFDAYKKSVEGKPRPAKVGDFTPEQRFFLGWAQVWATNYRPEAERLQAQTGPHPIARFRVNGPLSNMPAFAEAFSCKLGDKMVRAEADRCQVW